MKKYFEWSETKAARNLVKHGVSFSEAMRVFWDPLARVFDDDEHSWDERREIIIGHSFPQHRLVVSLQSGTRQSGFQRPRSNTPETLRL